jgi:hypothetical protein
VCQDRLTVRCKCWKDISSQTWISLTYSLF